jgi:hypothetical protein
MVSETGSGQTCLGKEILGGKGRFRGRWRRRRRRRRWDDHTLGVVSRKDELEEGVAGTFSGASWYETYGNLLWQYFTHGPTPILRNVAWWYPDG